jgi:uncharacterized protein YqeY
MLDEKISQDYVTAMKAKNKERSSTLSFLRAQLKNVKIDSRKETLDDGEVIAIIKKQVKQRQDSISQFEQGGRAELAEKEKAELAILREYLPAELPPEEIRAAVDEEIKNQGATSVKDMGKVMKAVLDKLQGRADSKDVSAMVKERLSTL